MSVFDAFLNKVLADAPRPVSICATGGITLGASSAYGAWAEVIDQSTTEDMVALQAQLSNSTTGSTNTTYVKMIQLGVGPVAAPTALNIEFPIVHKIGSSTHGFMGAFDLPAPLLVPRGRGLCARGKRDAAGTEGQHRIRFSGITLAAWLEMVERLNELGYEFEQGLLGVDYDLSEISNPAVGALPTPTTITGAGSSDTYSAWAQVTANIPQDGKVTFINMLTADFPAAAGQVNDFQIGIGPAGREQMVGYGRHSQHGSTASIWAGDPFAPLIGSAFLPAGSAVSIRSKNVGGQGAKVFLPVLKPRVTGQGVL